MNKKGQFVLLEGFDGVGKTTLSHYLANELNYEYHKSPEGMFSVARKYFDQRDTDFYDRLSFYSGVALRNSIIAEQLTSKGVNVVMDRYYHSLIAYHYKEYLSLSDKVKNIYNHLYQPDITFCLETDFKTICNRLLKNGVKLAPDDEIFVKEQLHRDITEIYRSVLPEMTIFIDNTGDLVDAATEITKHLKE